MFPRSQTRKAIQQIPFQKKNLQKYLPERSSFLYAILGGQSGNLNLRTNVYKDFLGESDRSDELKNKVISSMIPDEVLCSARDYRPRRFMTAMMFADISGKHANTFVKLDFLLLQIFSTNLTKSLYKTFGSCMAAKWPPSSK